MTEVIIIGNGGAALECHTLLADMMATPMFRDLYHFKGFLSHKGHKGGLGELSSHELGTAEAWQPDINEAFVSAIGDNLLRMEAYMQMKSRGGKFINLISPWAYISRDVRLGEANIIGLSSNISNAVSLGNCNFLNGDVHLGHNCRIGDGNFFAPRTLLSGNVTVGNENSFGPCSVILERARIGSANKIAPGAYVYKGCRDKVLMAGNPALKIGNL